MIGMTRAAQADFGAWKRDILFFDKMFVADARSAIGVWRNSPFGDRTTAPRQADELEYLLASDFFISNDDSARDILSITKDKELYKKFKPYIDAIDKVFSKYKPKLEGFKNWDDLQSRMSDTDVRIWGSIHSVLMLELEASFQQHQGIDAVLHGIPTWMQPQESGVRPGHAIELALANVPVPAETVAWEEIFAIKADPEMAHRARKLHLWANEMAKPGMTVERLIQYIQDSISDYESYMRANRIRFQSSILKTAVVGTAELFEDILHVRLGKLAARLFSVEEKRADFILAEARAPGRQLSLISAVKGKLRTSD
jgi:hypothetical protein